MELETKVIHKNKMPIEGHVAVDRRGGLQSAGV